MAIMMVEFGVCLELFHMGKFFKEPSMGFESLGNEKGTSLAFSVMRRSTGKNAQNRKAASLPEPATATNEPIWRNAA